MKSATQIIYRRITGSDFFNINKAPGTEVGGGGQSYIDVDTSGVSPSGWSKFFTGITPKMMKPGPAWDFTINSLSLGRSQTLRIGQRRNSSFSIRAQKLDSRASKRVAAWHPNLTPFPNPSTAPTSAQDPIIAPLISNLVIFIIRDANDEFWAGWFQTPQPDPSWSVDARLQPMFVNGDGHIELDPNIDFDETILDWPFTTTGGAAVAIPAATPAPPVSTSTAAAAIPAAAPVPPVSTSTAAAAIPAAAPVPPASTSTTSTGKATIASPRPPRTYKPRSQEELTEQLFLGDLVNDDSSTKEETRRVRERNQTAVRLLKDLYGKCQITGDEFIFVKANGQPYTEGHHLIPLGEGGADSPANLIIVSAHVHRMLHYADVPDIDLSKIENHKLDIEINGKKFTITWHPDHAKLVNNTNSP